LLLAAIGKEAPWYTTSPGRVGGLAAFGFCAIRSRSVAGRNWRHASSKSRDNGALPALRLLLRGRRHLAFAQQQRGRHIVGPFRTGIERMKSAARRSFQLHECPGAGAERIVSGIERQGHVAFIGRLFRAFRITIHNADGKMGLGALGRRFTISCPALYACLSSPRSRWLVISWLAAKIRLGSSCSGTLVCFIRPLEHGLAAVGVVGVVVANAARAAPRQERSGSTSTTCSRTAMASLFGPASWGKARL